MAECSPAYSLGDGNPTELYMFTNYKLKTDLSSIIDATLVSPLLLPPTSITHSSLTPCFFLQEKDHALDVVKLTDKDFLHRLENAVRFGKPCFLVNVGEELDPALEPILLQQVIVT